MPQFVKVAQKSDVPDGEALGVEAGGHKVAIVNVNGEYYAVGGTCTHEDGPLGEGYVEGEILMCPWHGGEFDVRTGKALRPPVTGQVPTYRVRVQGDDIEIEIPDL